MKVRNGFISNSSTSSFVMCGWHFDFDPEDFKDNNSIKKEFLKIFSLLDIDDNVINFQELDSGWGPLMKSIIYNKFSKELDKKYHNFIFSRETCNRDGFFIGIGDVDNCEIERENFKLIYDSYNILKKTFPKLRPPDFIYGECNEG